jgi:Uma2 family endonuclease
MRGVDELDLRRFTVDEYHRMIAAGILGEDEHVELVDGALVMTPPHGPEHVRAIVRLNMWLARACPPGLEARCQVPLTLAPDGEPEPDLALVAAGTPYAPHPVTAALVVEVSDSTLRYDLRVKLPLYARHALPEVWVVDVKLRAIVVHRAPVPAESRYAAVTTHAAGATLSPLVLPSLLVAVETLFAP